MAVTTIPPTLSPKAIKLLESLPDMIREAVLDIGVNLDGVEDQPTNCMNCIPESLVQAFKNGDYNAINKANQTTAKDIDPIYGNMRQNGEGAWFQLTNASNNTPYWMSIAGSPDMPKGYMWTYTPPSPPKGDNLGDDPSYVHTAQIGTLSREGKFLGISNQLWDNKALSVTAAVISTIVVSVATRYIVARMAGTPFAAAMSGAVAKAGASLVARNVVTAAGWANGAALAGKVVGGAVAGAVLTLLIMFIAEFVYKEYKCCINVYNFTSDKAFSVITYWGDNEEIDDDQDFMVAAMPPASKSVVLPDGTRSPLTTGEIASYSTYIFKNKNKILEGLGVTLRVQQSNALNSGVNIGYYLGRFLDNQIALGTNMNQSLKEFYNSKSSWAPKGSLRFNITMPDGTPVLGTTTALSGRSDQFYQYDVSIGLKPSANFGDDMPAVEPHVPREYPTIPEPLRIGSKITLPSGESAEVIGALAPQFQI